MGLLPDRLPGYAHVDDSAAREGFERLWGGVIPSKPGLTAPAMVDAAQNGKLKALYVMGANPLAHFGTLGFGRGKLDLLIVHEMFLTETAKLADIVFPAASAYEKEGSVTNTSGEIQLLHKAAEVMGPRTDFDLLRILSHQLERLGLGKAFHYKTPAAVFEEIRKAVPGYDVQAAGLLTGGAEATHVQVAKNGHAPYDVPVGLDSLRAGHAFHQRHAWPLLHHDGISSGGGSQAVNAFLIANATYLIITVIKIALLLFIVLTVNAYLTWFERKVVAHMQSRWGPHRVGPHGLLQPSADGAKFLLKEDPTPAGVDKFTYFLAPLMALALALTSLAIIPFGPEPLHWIFGDEKSTLGIADLNIGILALFAITALSVYGVALAGWSSNSKYPLLGGLRSSAQMVSYELALTMSVVGVLLLAGSFNLAGHYQRAGAPSGASASLAGIFGRRFLGFFCFFVAAVAETNRVPFDLPEAESELVAGFHTEYASFKFAMFFIAEYTSMITVSCLCTIMFFGGWLSPFPASWTLTHYLPSVILIPFGLWVIWDGIRYETIFGQDHSARRGHRHRGHRRGAHCLPAGE